MPENNLRGQFVLPLRKCPICQKYEDVFANLGIFLQHCNHEENRCGRADVQAAGKIMKVRSEKSEVSSNSRRWGEVTC